MFKQTRTAAQCAAALMLVPACSENLSGDIDSAHQADTLLGEITSALEDDSLCPATANALDPSATTVRQAHTCQGRNAGERIASAIASLPETGGTVDARGFGGGVQSVSETIHVGSRTKPVTLLMDPATIYVPTKPSLDMFSIGANGLVRGLTVDTCRAEGRVCTLAAFAGTAVKFDSTYSDGMRASLSEALLIGDATGTGVLLRSTTQYSSAFISISHLRTVGFNRGVHLHAQAQWVNDTKFQDVDIKNAVTCLLLQADVLADGTPVGDVYANQFLNFSCQAGPQSTMGVSLQGNVRGNSFVNLNVWDYAEIPVADATALETDEHTRQNQFSGWGFSAGAQKRGSDNTFVDLEQTPFNPMELGFGNGLDLVTRPGFGLNLLTRDDEGRESGWMVQHDHDGNLRIVKRKVSVPVTFTHDGLRLGACPITSTPFAPPDEPCTPCALHLRSGDDAEGRFYMCEEGRWTEAFSRPAPSLKADAIRIETSCPYVHDAHHDCHCRPDERVIGGGGFTQGVLQESRMSPRGNAWRVACANSALQRIKCVEAHAVCLKVSP